MGYRLDCPKQQFFTIFLSHPAYLEFDYFDLIEPIRVLSRIPKTYWVSIRAFRCKFTFCLTSLYVIIRKKNPFPGVQLSPIQVFKWVQNPFYSLKKPLNNMPEPSLKKEISFEKETERPLKQVISRYLPSICCK